MSLITDCIPCCPHVTGTELRLYNSKINAASLTLIASRLLAAHLPSPTAAVPSSTLALLDLGGNGIGDAGAQSLAVALASNTSLRHLFLAANRITAVGARAITLALQRNQNSPLCELFLFGNHLGDAGAQVLGDFLRAQCAASGNDGTGHPSIASQLCAGSTLSLSSSSATVGGTAVRSALTSLNVASNGIGCIGAAALASGLAQNACLKTLALGSQYFGNKIGDIGADAIADAMRVCSNRSDFPSISFILPSRLRCLLHHSVLIFFLRVFLCLVSFVSICSSTRR
jgi:hypothetical protein